MHIGFYFQKRNCLVVSLITSILVGIFILIFGDSIANLYDLTDTQIGMLQNCLRIEAFSMPLYSLGEYLGNYIVFKCYNKLLTLTNIMFYGVMILIDFVVVKFGYGIEELIIGTSITYLIYCIVLLPTSKILICDDRVNIKDLKLCFKHGSNMIIDRLLGKVATLTYNIFASKLGTELYAIHSICYSIGLFTEYVTAAQFNYQVVSLNIVNGAKEKFKKCKEIFLKTSLPIAMVGYTSAFILLPILHGDVNIDSCYIPLIIYSAECILLLPYESMRGYITSLKRSDILKWTGLVGSIIRIPLVLITYYCGLGFYIFASLVSIDFLCRAAYLYINAKKIIMGEEKC